MVALEKQVALRTQEFNHIILNLEQSEKQLKTHLNYQKDLNHSITHDISTPLHYLTTIIRNFFDRATNKEAIEAGEMYLLYEGAKRISDHTEKLMSLMKERLQADQFRSQTVNLHKLVSDAAAAFLHAAVARNNQFVNSIDPRVNININAKLLKIVLHNLVDNAIKNTERGGISFQVQQLKNQLSIEISDTGKGKPDFKLRELKAFLADQTHKNLHMTGLGFKMIMDILSMINGQLTILSEEGNGTTVRILLPYSVMVR
ncbi:hypothetical protein DSL64_01885 [Dyadobacter luteus]|uniref:histidine kinase n=1 Tax=Dyadobacter luteus TaxID=2259619 RepID=A0A3D8YHN5_9BACT|nr:HAMP domain-containing sensor histidine kinase [Dyadobacter luteus]REA64324.1 hypothetical protein DSL64_01885 [Dyadobacter luteus]